MRFAPPVAVPAAPQVHVGDWLIPTDSTDAEAGTTVDLPDDEPEARPSCEDVAA